MKCKDCDYKMKGFFACAPDKYVCIGVKEPFVIENTDVECTEYPEKRDPCVSTVKVAPITEVKPAKAYVGDDGIYVPSRYGYRCYELLMSRELFVEAYNKWIKDASTNQFIGVDDADDWSED